MLLNQKGLSLLFWSQTELLFWTLEEMLFFFFFLVNRDNIREAHEALWFSLVQTRAEL